MDDDLVTRLQAALGPAAVSTDATVIDSHATDAWPVSVLTRQLGRSPHRPDVVVVPKDERGVQAVMAVAAESGTAVTPWGLGSSVTGQPLPLEGGISLDVSGLCHGPELHEQDRTVTVGAGMRGSDLEAWLNQRGYTLNHFPQSLDRSSVGGWLATRATGQFSSRYGGIEDLVSGYRVVQSDGTVAELVQRPRAAMGPDLRGLFLGSEGTLGVITEATLRVFALPPVRLVDAVVLPSMADALDVVRTTYQAGARPFLLRLYDADEAGHVLPGDDSLAAHEALLLFGSEGVGSIAQAEFDYLRAALDGAGARSLGTAPVEHWMARRFDFSGVESLLAEPGGYAETVEVANMWSRLHPMYLELKQVLAPLADEVLGHFSHVYDQGASLYVILRGRAADNEQALERVHQVWAAAMEVVVRHDGELSHHHGGGLARRPWVRQSLGSAFPVLQRVKHALDPDGLFNPGKLDLEVATTLGRGRS